MIIQFHILFAPSLTLLVRRWVVIPLLKLFLRCSCNSLIAHACTLKECIDCDAHDHRRRLPLRPPAGVAHRDRNRSQRRHQEPRCPSARRRRALAARGGRRRRDSTAAGGERTAEGGGRASDDRQCGQGVRAAGGRRSARRQCAEPGVVPDGCPSPRASALPVLRPKGDGAAAGLDQGGEAAVLGTDARGLLRAGVALPLHHADEQLRPRPHPRWPRRAAARRPGSMRPASNRRPSHTRPPSVPQPESVLCCSVV